jgi:large subunit ribosomal protein L15
MDLKTVTLKGTKHAHVFRVGRGIGSGLGKTCGRGHKGWGARSGAYRRPGYEGGQMPIYRRVPKRGFTNARFRTEYTIINAGALEVFDSGAVVDLAAVLAKGLASLNVPALKVLGDGALTKALTVRAQKFSKSAAEKIRAAGGAVVLLDARGRERAEPEAAPAQPAAKRAKKPKADEAKADEAKPEEKEPGG